ncbi:MAG: hypothetical protein ACKVOB_04795 [Sphingomonas sp.]
MTAFRSRPPLWHHVVVALLAVWNAVGCYFCYLQFRLGADWMADATDYDRALMASLPGWYNYCYAVGVGAGLLGAVALLAGSRAAVALFALSLAAVIVQFGYLFATTDVIAQKGAGTVLPFPIFIAVVAGVAFWGARRAVAKGWAR